MKKLACIIVIVACFVIVGTCFAEQPALMKGGWEMGWVSNIDFEGPTGLSMVDNGSVGYFIMDNLEIGAVLTTLYIENGADNGDDLTAFGLGPFVEYNFDLEMAVVPYVGASLTYQYLDAGTLDDDAFQVRGDIGIKYFMTENWALDGAIYLAWASEDIFPNDGEFKDTDIGLVIGIRTYF